MLQILFIYIIILIKQGVSTTLFNVNKAILQ